MSKKKSFCLILYHAGIEGFFQGVLVEVLTYEDELLHTVAILLVPIGTKTRIAIEHILQLGLRHGGIPLPGIGQRHLLACLFEEVAEMLLTLEVADTLGADDVLWPETCHEMVKES